MIYPLDITVLTGLNDVQWSRLSERFRAKIEPIIQSAVERNGGYRFVDRYVRDAELICAGILAGHRGIASLGRIIGRGDQTSKIIWKRHILKFVQAMLDLDLYVGGQCADPVYPGFCRGFYSEYPRIGAKLQLTAEDSFSPSRDKRFPTTRDKFCLIRGFWRSGLSIKRYSQWAGIRYTYLHKYIIRWLPHYRKSLAEHERKLRENRNSKFKADG